MLTAAFIVGWNVQVYRCSPGWLATYFQLLPGAIDFESNAPSAAVAECGKGSLFTYTTVSPRLTLRVSGENARPSITTV